MKEMLWLCLALPKRKERWDGDLPSRAEDQRAKPGTQNLGERGDRAAIDSSCGQHARIPPDAALEACDAPKSSRVIDGPEQGTGRGTSAWGWTDDEQRKGTVHRAWALGTVQNL